MERSELSKMRVQHFGGENVFLFLAWTFVPPRGSLLETSEEELWQQPSLKMPMKQREKYSAAPTLQISLALNNEFDQECHLVI